MSDEENTELEPELEPEEQEIEEVETEIVSEIDAELSQVDNLEGQEEKIIELELEAKENHDKYLRAIAELENYKKRTLKERAELIRYAGESVIIDLIDVLDDLGRACSAEARSVEDVLEGVIMIKNRFEGVFKKHSVESKDAIGQEFDPNCHEALTTVPTDEHKPGVVIEQFRKAYFFKDKLIRTAQVVVSAKLEEKE